MVTSNAGSAGSISGWGTKISHAAGRGRKQIKQTKEQIFFFDFLKKFYQWSLHSLSQGALSAVAQSNEAPVNKKDIKLTSL